MQRRSLLLGGAVLGAAALLVGCSGSSGGVSFDQAKAYADAAIDATLAAAQQYLMGPPAPTPQNMNIVTTIVADLVKVKAVLDGTQPGAAWNANVQIAISDINQLVPMLSDYLGGSVTADIHLALDVLAAFVAALPPPANAPPTPPASLRHKAMEYRHA